MLKAYVADHKPTQLLASTTVAADTPYIRTYITGDSGEPLSASDYGKFFAFTGQRYDADLDLYHFKHRSYSPDLGQWLQRDPHSSYRGVRRQYGDGMSLYQYVVSNPIRLTDPDGLNPFAGSDEIPECPEDEPGGTWDDGWCKDLPWGHAAGRIRRWLNGQATRL